MKTPKATQFGAAILGLGILVAPAAFAQPDAANGEALYQAKCNMCHASGLANAPLTEALTKLEAQKIIDVLTKPSAMMAGAVAGITDQEKRDIAEFLTRKPVPADGEQPKAN
jgi:cytochrome c5